MIGLVKLHQKHQKQTKFWDSIRKWRSYWKKCFLDKSKEEDEVKEEHAKLVLVEENMKWFHDAIRCDCMVVDYSDMCILRYFKEAMCRIDVWETTLETFGRSNVFKVKVDGAFRMETCRGLKTIGTKFFDIGRTVFEKSQ